MNTRLKAILPAATLAALAALATSACDGPNTAPAQPGNPAPAATGPQLPKAAPTPAASSATTGSATTGSASTGSSGTGSAAPATTPPKAGTGSVSSVPSSYTSLRAAFSVQPTGYAAVAVPKPAGWSGYNCRDTDGVTDDSPTYQVDCRDASGELLLRLSWEPDKSGGTAAGLPFTRYANLPGYRLISWTKPYQDKGLLASDWQFTIPAQGATRYVQVRSWLLDGVRVTVYLSGPDSEPNVWDNVVYKISKKAFDVTFRTYIGHDA